MDERPEIDEAACQRNFTLMSTLADMIEADDIAFSR